MGEHVKYVSQGMCASCGSENVHPVTLVGGRRGENILVFFGCDDCGCDYIECYEYESKGIIEREES